MLKGIAPCISPELLFTLASMGHGDEIVFADAHFPADSMNARVLRADGLEVVTLLKAVLPLFELDSYVPDPVVMMSAVAGDSLDAELVQSYTAAIKFASPNSPAIVHIDRFAFYDRARKAFAVVVTSTTKKYGNIILKKGVTPII